MIYNPFIQYLPEKDEFPFESGSSQSFFLMSSQEIFFATVGSDLLIRHLNLLPDVYKAAV